MADSIIKIGYEGTDHYFIWSIASKKPITESMTRKEVREYVDVIEGAAGLRTLFDRLERVDKHGTSYPNTNLELLLRDNKAGPDGKCITKEEIVKQYSFAARS